MDLNLNSCLSVYNKTAVNIADALSINNPENKYALPFITRRALIIFKLELILFKHREEFDKKRQILYGKNALTHYLFHKKGVSIADAKDISFHDALIILWDIIDNYVIPENIIIFISQHSDNYGLVDEDATQLAEKNPIYKDGEWDANFADKRLSQ